MYDIDVKMDQWNVKPDSPGVEFPSENCLLITCKTCIRQQAL